MDADAILGLSLSLTNVVYGHMSAEIASAGSISGSLIQLISILNIGWSGAAAIVIGNTIGEGDFERAKREGNSYILMSFIFGLVVIIPILLLRGPYVSMYSIQPGTAELVYTMLNITFFMLPIQTVAYVISKGILRGGGDTRFLLLADSSLVWFLSLPLGALAAFVWHMSPAWVYFFLRVEFPLKGVVCFIRYCTGKWIKEIRAKG